MNVALLRHGEVAGGARFRGHTDDPLTEVGWAQMQSALPADVRWDWIVTSPLQRCAKFAQQFAAQHKLRLTSDPRLQEIHFGTWEGRTAADIMDTEPDALTRFWQDPFAHPPPEGETLTDFQTRVLAAWAEIQNMDAEQVLLVTHGGVIRILLHELGLYPDKSLLEIEVPYGALFNINTPK